jgi:hypothetical protein
MQSALVRDGSHFCIYKHLKGMSSQEARFADSLLLFLRNFAASRLLFASRFHAARLAAKDVADQGVTCTSRQCE